MWKALSDKAKSGLKDLNERKDQYLAEKDKEKRERWISQVVRDGKGEGFKKFTGWKDTFEPPRSGAAASVSAMAEKKLMAALALNMTENLMRMLCEVISKPLEAAQEVLIGNNEQIMAQFLNATEGALLTYRFEYANKAKFTFLRGYAVDRMALALLAALDQEVARCDSFHGDEEGEEGGAPGGGASREIDPVLLQAIVSRIGEQAAHLVAQQQAHAKEALASSNFFKMTGATDEQVDAGVKLLMEFIQGYADTKVAAMMATFNQVVVSILEIAVKHRQVIALHVAAKVKREKDNAANIAAGKAPIDDEDEPEYIAVRTEILTILNDRYQFVFNKIHGFITSFFAVIETGSAQQAI